MNNPALRQLPARNAARPPPQRRRLALLLPWLLAMVLVACASNLSRESSRFDALRSALAARNYAQARELIQRYPETLDNRRAVSMAIALGDPHAVALFARQAGANSELDLDGTTPLLRSVTAAPPAAREEIVSVLLGLGADPRQADRNGTDAAGLARRRGEQRLLAMMNDSMGIGSDRRATDGPAATAQWMPPPDQAGPVPPAGARGARGRTGAGKARGAPAGTGKANARPLTLPQGLFTDIWIAASASPASDIEIAAFRFHADGTGELLRVTPKRPLPLRQPDAYLAWTIEGGRLAFFVVSDLFAARCESTAATATALSLTCTDYAISDREDDRAASVAPSMRTVGASMSQDMARSMLDQMPASTRLTRGATLQTVLRHPPTPVCKPRRVQHRPAADVDYKRGAHGDWYALDTRQAIAYPALSGAACQQDEARREALTLCNRAAGSCVNLGGCRAGTASAVAGTAGSNWAWVACTPFAQDAAGAALARCHQASGCDCQLLAIGGANVNTQRGATCRPPASISRH